MTTPTQFRQQHEQVQLVPPNNTSDELVIEVEVKDVYGKPTYYPICFKSTIFSHIAGTTTLTPTTLKLIKDLGYSIKCTYKMPEEILRL